MREALEHPRLLGGAIPGESWLLWRVLLIAAMGEALTDEERELFLAVTGRESEPLQMVEEFWGIVGRRGGKTRAAGTLAAYVGGLCDHDGYLAPGERGVLPILAASVSQASRAFVHAKGIIHHSPELTALLDGEPTAGTIRLTTRIDIEVRPASFRTIRGITAVAAVCDEVAFWQVENSSNPDSEILDALRPALATTGGPLMVISSPHAKRGEVWETHKRDYGPDGDPLVLVAKGPSRLFNPTLSAGVVERAYQRDAAKAAAEYGGEFRNDLEAFVSVETVEACVSPGLTERPPEPGRTYRAFVDPSGGSMDSMTLGITHLEGETVVLDAVREAKPPFSPAAVVDSFCTLLRTYRIGSVTGDRYSGDFVRELFRRNGIAYRLVDIPKSGLYLDLLPRLNARTIDLLDLPALKTQLVGLERRVAWGGRESIDHKTGAHDDVANVVAGASHVWAQKFEAPIALFGSYSATGSALHPLGGSWVPAGPSRRRAEVEDLPPPLWVQHPANDEQRIAAADYLRRRSL
jgi:hypothetical protein